MRITSKTSDSGRFLSFKLRKHVPGSEDASLADCQIIGNKEEEKINVNLKNRGCVFLSPIFLFLFL